MTDSPAPALDLRCPVCADPLVRMAHDRRPDTLACPAGHRFDAAKQGYFNFLTGRGTPFTEDTAAMVAARAGFLDEGHYSALAEAVARAALAGSPAGPGGGLRILDAGAGTGYYLRHVMEAAREAGARPAALALDISRYAMRRTARLPDTTAVVWDVWRPLPLGGAAVDVVLNVFAPRNGPEFARVLAPGGTAVVVTPLPGHLAEAAAALGLLGIAGGKEESVAATLGDAFDPTDVQEVRCILHLSAGDAVRLAVMGPAGHHIDPQELRARLEAEGVPDPVSGAFRVQSFRRR